MLDLLFLLLYHRYAGGNRVELFHFVDFLLPCRLKYARSHTHNCLGAAFLDELCEAAVAEFLGQDTVFTGEHCAGVSLYTDAKRRGRHTRHQASVAALLNQHQPGLLLLYKGAHRAAVNGGRYTRVLDGIYLIYARSRDGSSEAYERDVLGELLCPGRQFKGCGSALGNDKTLLISLHTSHLTAF